MKTHFMQDGGGRKNISSAGSQARLVDSRSTKFGILQTDNDRRMRHGNNSKDLKKNVSVFMVMALLQNLQNHIHVQ